MVAHAQVCNSVVEIHHSYIGFTIQTSTNVLLTLVDAVKVVTTLMDHFTVSVTMVMSYLMTEELVETWMSV